MPQQPFKPAPPNKPVLARAFELARSGDYVKLLTLEEALEGEGYRAGQIVGPSLRKQLKALCVASSKPREPVVP